VKREAVDVAASSSCYNASEEPSHKENENSVHLQPETTPKSNVFTGSDRISPAGIITKEDGSEVNVGFHESHDEVVVSNPGRIAGVTLMLFRTNAPARVVNQIRGMGCGPILSLITCSSSPEYPAKRRQVLSPFQTAQEAKRALDHFLGVTGDKIHVAKFQKALGLWAHHARTWSERWGDGIFSSCEYLDSNKEALEGKIRGELPLSFRASCVRANSKNYGYNRDELLAVIGAYVPTDKLEGKPLLPISQVGCKSKDNHKIGSVEPWRVDLKAYGVEIVAFVMNEGDFALGISLLPYQLLGTRSFSARKIPSDITPPYVRGGMKNLISLRPSIASLLLHIADPQPSDLVVDPCAGLGTFWGRPRFLESNWLA